ncbi:DUF4190 domain-containing protein [Candidatus Woesearchaeota archaeon]|nr:DUF4190 domain-containing protein [Candidatus Woesearchaeota archaeon]
MADKSTVSLVLGVLGFALMMILPFISIVLGVLAVVFGILGRKKKKDGRSTAGIVLGVIAIIGSIVMFVFAMKLLSWFFSYDFDKKMVIHDICKIGNPLPCIDMFYSGDTIQFNIRNDFERDITINRVFLRDRVTGETCGIEEPFAMAMGEIKEISIDCGLEERKVLGVEIWVLTDYGYEWIVQGELQMKDR